MKKSTIVRIWITGVVVLVAGILLGGISLGLLLGLGGHWVPATTPNNYNFIPTTDQFFWTTLGLSITGGVILLVGGIVQLVAWIGALVNTNQLAEKTWFIILLVSGILSLAFGLIGFAGMIAYVIAGPDGLAQQQQQNTPGMPQPWVQTSHP